MSSLWSWIFGILTAAALVLGVIFFVATQQITGRDWLVLCIGLVLGAMIAALVATFVVHRGPQVRSKSSTELSSPPPAATRPPSSARVTIGVPGQVVHGKLRTSLNIRTRVHNVYWRKTGSPAGELRPGRGERFDVVDAEDRHLGHVTSLKDGMELLERSFEE